MYMSVCSVGCFTNVTADFQSKMPVINAVAGLEGESYKLQVVVSNAECVETSQLLAVYSQIDPRVRPLAMTFRYWAKVSTVLVVVIIRYLCLEERGKVIRFCAVLSTTIIPGSMHVCI